NIRQNTDGMTRGWAIFGDKVQRAVQENIIDVLEPLGQVHHWPDGNWNIGQIDASHSLIPYSLEAKKPVFDCTSRD
ncbi:hypothetical protein, partial [Salmonella enterica]|uniref:hypothetical protein n=1 Tax=Salmonella enterica TaxID=28901 RepID=UPI003075D4E1